MSRISKILLYMVSDAIIIEFSLLASISLWAEGGIPGSHALGITQEVWHWFGYIGVAAPIIGLAVYASFKMYNSLWKYASIDEIIKIFVATTLIFVLLYLFHVLYISRYSSMVLARRMLFVAWTLNTMLFVFVRFGYRLIKRVFIFISHMITSKAGLKRVLIIGAGYAASGVIRDMLSAKIRDKMPVLVIDDDPGKSNTHIMGIRVIFGTDKIPEIAEKYQVDEIIIAITNISNVQVRRLIDICTQTECTLKILPPISDVSDGKNWPVMLRDVNISDLLEREEVKLDTKNISSYLSNRIILVTGGGGSIGSELCRQIMKFGPKLLIIFDIYENNAYELLNELRMKYKEKTQAIIRIGSVRDENRLREIFDEFNPHVVFHAAAHKHVGLMEDSPAEAVKNNVFGAYNTALCAHRSGAERFILLSTDKAVNPSSVMGATKRITELIVQNMAAISDTKFIVVRFGNVLGSNGSVVPLFMSQIQNGGPVTVTHPEIERYFMTIPEACQLVLQATGLGKTGRIFVLDMGSPVKIAELAKNLIKLSGYRPGRDIEIIYTGLRPGEKLYEELILSEEQEALQLTCHKKIFITKPIEIDSKDLELKIQKLREAVTKQPSQILDCIKELVPNFREGE